MEQVHNRRLTWRLNQPVGLRKPQPIHALLTLRLRRRRGWRPPLRSFHKTLTDRLLGNLCQHLQQVDYCGQDRDCGLAGVHATCWGHAHGARIQGVAGLATVGRGLVVQKIHLLWRRRRARLPRLRPRRTSAAFPANVAGSWRFRLLLLPIAAEALDRRSLPLQPFAPHRGCFSPHQSLHSGVVAELVPLEESEPLRQVGVDACGGLGDERRRPILQQGLQ
mmetsp:Transcript_55631/g.161179  ORF Transcript_55631/g.161179 Transcript_55631/m.161179 type:complete len:221 (-) Transcript_55631:353-1015(-)